jgi:hypothetical protein
MKKCIEEGKKERVACVTYPPIPFSKEWSYHPLGGRSDN